MRSSMMVRRESSSREVAVIGEQASLVLSSIQGISDVRVENQYVDRATLSLRWKVGGSNFDFRPDFEKIDQQLQAMGMHRMQ